MVSKGKQRKYHSLVGDVITFGAGGAAMFFVRKINDLYTIIESIISGDGQKLKISKILSHVRAKSADIFGIGAAIVQTAGTISDTVDIASPSILDSLLDGVIDDVYGYQIVTPFGVSRSVPGDDPTANTTQHQAREFSVRIPGNIIQLLNKELETERLQNLYLVFYGTSTVNNQVVNIQTVNEIDFTGIRKTITIR